MRKAINLFDSEIRHALEQSNGALLRFTPPPYAPGWQGAVHERVYVSDDGKWYALAHVHGPHGSGQADVVSVDGKAWHFWSRMVENTYRHFYKAQGAWCNRTIYHGPKRRTFGFEIHLIEYIPGAHYRDVASPIFHKRLPFAQMPPFLQRLEIQIERVTAMPFGAAWEYANKPHTTSAAPGNLTMETPCWVIEYERTSYRDHAIMIGDLLPEDATSKK